MLRDPELAVEAAVAALRRAGRSRSSVLGHARYQALSYPEPLPPAADTPAPDDITELATLLAASRPAAERAVLDLRARLDRAELGRALGASAASAAERADAIAETWDHDLDPQLMAALGPGDCLDLAAVLADLGLTHPTLGDLAAAAPAVAAHVAACDMCTDRHRAMVSVRSLVGQPVTDVPEPVREAARRSRRMRPAQPPPPFEPRRRRPLVVAGVAAAIALAVAAIGATAAALVGGNGGRAGRVADLVRVPAGAQLVMVIRGDAVEVTNRTRQRVHWRASTDAAWLRIRPDEGNLEPGASAMLRPRVLRGSPEGALRSLITVAGDDGSAAAAVYTTTIERPPDVAAVADGCVVTATVEDTSGVGAVTLHWIDVKGAHDAPMTASADRYSASLPPGPVTWSVAATDARGNLSRSPETKSAC